MYDQAKEIREAKMAGDRAISSLLAARDQLNSARNWGVMDMLGGSLISSAMKHSKINKAQANISRARTSVREFQRELQDVRGIDNLSVEIGDFLRFADIFFDSFIVDFMVQSRIREAQRQVDEAITQVRRVLNRLNAL